MKLTIERQALAEVMSRGGASAPKISAVPILGHVMLTARARTLRAITTDLDLQAEATTAAEVVQEGEITVSADALRSFVDKLPANATVSIELSKADLVVKSGRMRARFPTLPAKDFPSLDVIEKDGRADFSLTGVELTRLFGLPLPAAERGGVRSYLQGVYLHVVPGDAGLEMRSVATNGHMLLRSSIGAPEGSEGIPADEGRRGAIVPSAASALALKLFGRDESVRVTVAPRGLVFEAGTTRLITKRVEGTYPNSERVIPQEGPNRVILDKASCLIALGAIEVFITKDSGRAIECGPDEEGLALATGSATDGDGFAVAHADFEGAVEPFGVNSVYLRTVLGAFQSDIVILSVDTPGTPIRIFDEKDPSVIGVVMPMRVSMSLLKGQAEA